MTELQSLGEFRIINEILRSRYASVPGFGDDCAWIDGKKFEGVRALLATTDPCPEPAAFTLGFEDEYFRGWLLATINFSDIAASGGVPVGLLTSLILPGSWTTYQLERLLEGIDHCCDVAGTHVLGGNIKEGPAPELSATALGTCARAPLSRVGARAGDSVIYVGELGLFWGGYLSIKNGVEIPESLESALLKNVLTPNPRVKEGMVLAASGLVTSCTDNSDGLYTTLRFLADQNGVGVHVDADKLEWTDPVKWAASNLGLDEMRLAMGWGDWNLIATCDQKNTDAILDQLRVSGTNCGRLGYITEDRGIRASHHGEVGKLMELNSERFTKDSWFTSGIDGYIEKLNTSPIVCIENN